MSFSAIRWALAQPVGKASAKFVLVAMADCVNGSDAPMTCWPTVACLAELTSMDRKTVIEAMQRLRAAGWIQDTGARKGATGQVPVYELKTPKTGTVTPPESAGNEEGNGTELPPPNSTETGTDTKTGTVPDFPPNSTVFPHKESRFSLSTVPKAGHGTSNEPVKNQEGTRKRRASFDAAAIPLPDWLDAEVWGRWVRDRKGRNKAITEDAAKLHLAKLTQYRTQGYEPHVVIDTAIENHWTGLWEPKGKPRSSTPGKHAGLSEIKYAEGVNADGTFA